MIKSIRFRLLIWSAIVLVTVIGGFDTILYYQVKSARMGDIDSQLDTASAALDASLRLFPRFELTGEPMPPRMGGPNRPDRRFDDRPPFDPENPRPFRQGEGRMFNGPDGERRGPPGERGPPLNPNGREHMMSQLVLPAKSLNTDEPMFFAVWRTDSALLKSGGPFDGRSIPTMPSTSRIYESRGDIRELLAKGPWDSLILVGRPITHVRSELSALRWQLLGTSLCVLAVGLVGGWLVSQRIFLPVTRISETAARISGDNLSERIDESQIDVELGGLAKTLNGTFSRLEAAFDRQARFTADASHELRTPLAVIRSQAELALLRERKSEEYKAALESCHSSAVRMTDLVDRLLALARADAGWPGLIREPVAFDRLVLDVVELMRPLAEKKGLSMKARVKPAQVVGDNSILTQLVTNLISNAITYNKIDGKIRISVDPVDGGVSFIVADTGVGISEADSERLFERFFRVDKARSRSSGGTGLGLAICKAIVDAHGGVIDVESTEGKGSEFRVWFPAEARAGQQAAEGKAKGVERAVARPHAGDIQNGHETDVPQSVPDRQKHAEKQATGRETK